LLDELSPTRSEPDNEHIVIYQARSDNDTH